MVQLSGNKLNTMIDKSKFIPGLKLSEMFYQEAVKPILDTEFPSLSYSAALMGSGSEVLGFDTSQSMDHHWGPRVQLFLREQDYEQHKDKVEKVISEKLPYTFHDIPTNFGNPDTIGVQLLEEINSGPVSHRVRVGTIGSFFQSVLAFNPYNEITVSDWLVFPEQHLLSVTSGKVFHDGLGKLEKMRDKFQYYPHDVWLYILSCQWTKISQEEAFVGRCGEVGDELGSRLIANRIIQFLMKLCFLMDKQYSPYYKWFGTGFSRLEIAPKLIPIFNQVQSATTWKEREKYLSQAYEIIAERHNSLNITVPLETKVSSYHERPYLVIHADQFAEKIKKAITDEAVKKVIKRNIGSVDQFIDSTDVLSHPDICKKLNAVYE